MESQNEAETSEEKRLNLIGLLPVNVQFKADDLCVDMTNYQLNSTLNQWPFLESEFIEDTLFFRISATNKSRLVNWAGSAEPAASPRKQKIESYILNLHDKCTNLFEFA